VHAFATDPARGVFILSFLGIVIGGSLSLFAWRAASVGFSGRFDRVSRESLLLVNNVLLVAATGSVMLGTLYPLALDALGLGKISVGTPYFEAVFVPLMAPVVLLMGVGPLARWKAASWADMASRLRWPAMASVAAALVLPWWAGRFSAGVALGLFLAAWVFTSTAALLLARLRGNTLGERWKQLGRSSRSFFGMVVAHLGVGIFIVGVTMVRGFDVESDVKMSTGDHLDIGGYSIRFKGVSESTGPNYVAVQADINVQRDGGDTFSMKPEKRLYKVQQMPMTEAAIDTGFLRDVYISLGEPLDDKTWTLRVYIKPFVDWIWGGALVMALGGLLAATDRRYRVSRVQSESAESGLAGAAQRIDAQGATP
jgi:cytochrome c-type biogenesis protein CcmF